MNVLFLCSRNQLRSPTAEDLFQGRHDIQARSAGLVPWCDNPLDADTLEWADVVFVMEDVHRRWLAERHPGSHGKRVVCLGIRDVYRRDDPRLIDILERKVGGVLGLPRDAAPGER